MYWQPGLYREPVTGIEPDIMGSRNEPNNTHKKTSDFLKLPRMARRHARIYRQRISTTQKTKSRWHDANPRQSFVHARIREGTVSIGQLRIESKQVEAAAAADTVHFCVSVRIMKSHACMYKIKRIMNQTQDLGKLISQRNWSPQNSDNEIQISVLSWIKLNTNSNSWVVLLIKEKKRISQFTVDVNLKNCLLLLHKFFISIKK